MRKGNGQSPQFFKWNDITNLVNHKRYFGIECQSYDRSAQFLLDESDSAKYVWKMCVLQHTFYKMHSSATDSNELNITLENHHQQPSHHHTSTPFDNYLDYANYGGTLHMFQPPPSSNPLQHSEIESFHAAQAQRVDMVTTRHLQITNQPSQPPEVYPQQMRPAISSLSIGNNMEGTGRRPQTIGAPLSAARSVNDLDQLTAFYGNPVQHHVPPPLASATTAMPTMGTTGFYNRPAPDYETAVRNKYGNGILTQLAATRTSNQHPIVINSNHCASQPSLINNVEAAPAPTAVQPDNLYHQTSMYSTSTPELNNLPMSVSSQPPQPTQEQIVAELQRLNIYKPPPPYPGRTSNKVIMSSTSTPDLASVNHHQAVPPGYNYNMGGSSPDLVSRRNLGATPGAYSTEELNYRVQEKPVKHYSENGEPIYQNQAELRQLVDDSSPNREPIYQNLPAHENMIQPEESSDTTETVEPMSEDSNSKPVSSSLQTTTTESAKIKGHVSRVAITNSREDLSERSSSRSESYVTNNNLEFKEFVRQEDDACNLTKNEPHKKSVTKINIISSEESEVITNFSKPMNAVSKAKAKVNPIKKPERRKSLDVSKLEQVFDKSSDSSGAVVKETPTPAKEPVAQHSQISARNSIELLLDNHHHQSPRTPSSKPRGVRRKWGFHFGGSKSGSLKSIKSNKSDSVDNLDVSGKSEVKFGPMMMATLHGLTRSRPDLLTESLATFSTFTTPAKMPKDEIGAHLEAKLAEGEVLREFERIPKRKLDQDPSAAKNMFKTAVLAENVGRNRFKDVLPYEENRVRLTATDKDNKTGYINASHVSATVGDQQRFYVAAQNPLPSTIVNFWQMVLQCDIHVIVMLTESSVGDTGGMTSTCLPYWPQKNGSTLEVGEFKVSKQFTSAASSGAYTTSTLSIEHTKTRTTRTVWHLQYTDWGEAGCPMDVRSYLEFLEEMSSLRRHVTSEMMRGIARNRNPPLLVHCSAGVGRTGVTILSDILLYCVDHNIDIDIPKILTHLRQQRMLMVQTIAQYKFVHTVLINYLKQSRLI